jgi:hypothetical protein
LEEILIKKGFDPIWIAWMMQSVKHGNLAININGEQGPYFPSTRGVQQGDPISPLLFDYVVDGLAAMVDAARRAGHITGLDPNLIADDMVILLEKSDLNVLHMKFLLYCFESDTSQTYL